MTHPAKFNLIRNGDILRHPDAPATHYRVARYDPHNQQLTLLVQEANSYRQMTAAEFNAEAFYFDGGARQ